MVPFSTSCRMVSHMSVRLLGSSPVVGSSKKMMGASPDQAHGDVEPASHPAREGQQAAVGRLVEIERVEQVRRGLPGIGDVAQLAHQHQVLPGGEHVVHRGELSGQADLLADLGGLLRHVEPGDARRAAVGVDQRGQDVDRGRLAQLLAPSRANSAPRPTVNDTSWSTGSPLYPFARSSPRWRWCFRAWLSATSLAVRCGDLRGVGLAEGCQVADTSGCRWWRVNQSLKIDRYVAPESVRSSVWTDPKLAAYTPPREYVTLRVHGPVDDVDELGKPCNVRASILRFLAWRRRG